MRIYTSKIESSAPGFLARGYFIVRKKGTFMNDCQRRQIETMRKQGMGYKAIARKTKLSRDSVRNYCRWHHLAGYGRAVAAAFREEQACQTNLNDRKELAKQLIPFNHNEKLRYTGTPGSCPLRHLAEAGIHPDNGREHHPWRQSRPQMDGRQRGHAPGFGREHQAGQRKIRRTDRRNRGVHHGTGSGHP